MASKPRRLVDNPELEPFYVGIEEFCSNYLAGSSEVAARSINRKIIADPVEGYSTLYGWEVGIIDTPLFQRLRYIRQLGLAYLVYPTLDYSRFEHVIGVRARLEQVIATLKENEGTREKAETTESLNKYLTQVRLAALCHDIGHCLFSHVSEAVLEGLPGSSHYPSAQQIVQLFSDYAGRKIPISEILSVAIITSPSFIAHLRECDVPHCSRVDRATQVAFDAARFVLGLPATSSPDTLYLGQLMNSGLDVDKLDYMLRESLLSGISLGISLGWLMKKLFVARLSGVQVPQGLRSRLSGFRGEETYLVLALERGGQFAFEEFSVARLALHEKVYLHQKIRAAEAQAKRLFKTIAEEVDGYSEVHRWLYLKESMFNLPEMEFSGLPDRDIFNFMRRRTPESFGTAFVAERDLFARAYGFGWQNSIGDPLERDGGEFGVDKLLSLANREVTKIVLAIRSSLAEVFKSLEIEDVQLDQVDLIVDPPRLSSIQQGHDTIHIEYPSRLAVRWTMPIDRIEDYYHKNRAVGYVYTQRRYLPYVLLAAEKAAWDLCKVVCVQEGVINSKVLKESAEMRVSLDKAGFYSQARDLRPISSFLSSVEAQLQVQAIAERLAPFESYSKRKLSTLLRQSV